MEISEDKRKLLWKFISREISENTLSQQLGCQVDAKFILSGIESAFTQKNIETAALFVHLGYIFGFDQTHVDILNELLLEAWHKKHENIAFVLGELRSPSSVDFLYNAALMKLPYLEDDDSYNLVERCIYALWKIWTPYAKEKLLALANEANPAIAANVNAFINGITDLHKLDTYYTVPRSDSSSFFLDTAGKPPLLGKDKWRNSFINAPLVYAKIVQANTDLFIPGNAKFRPVVMVFALDPVHCNNILWLYDTVDKICQMKEAANVPDDCRKFIDVMRDDFSRFCFPLNQTIAGTADAWCVTFTINEQSVLPGQRLPLDGILPFLLVEHPQKLSTAGFLSHIINSANSIDLKIQNMLRLIPGRYYQDDIAVR